MGGSRFEKSDFDSSDEGGELGIEGDIAQSNLPSPTGLGTESAFKGASASSSLERHLNVDRRAFLSATVLSVATLSLRHQIAEAVGKQKTVSRTITAERRYLNLPVCQSGPKCHLKMLVDGQVLREFSISLAEGVPDWWAFTDLDPLKGKVVTLEVENLPAHSKALMAITQSDWILGQDAVYHEALRPQFHFSTQRGIQSDANGLVFYAGEYHLFYQHDPYHIQFGDGFVPRWGHAVSKDLVHWVELPEAIEPEEGYEQAIASGSAIVDAHNSTGFQTRAEEPMVAMYTYVRSTSEIELESVQGIAFSNDRGRTWTKYRNNPVLPRITTWNRDPKVIWYAPEKKWVMMLFLDQADYGKHPEVPPEELLKRCADRSSFGLFSSRDLKTWEKMSEIKIEGETECPEFFEIAVDGYAGNPRWIAQGANGRYLIGSFDGRTFTPESGPHVIHSGNCFYASQTFNNVPASDGRRILIPWGRSDDPHAVSLYKGMPFNQMMGIPLELTLRMTSDAGLQLFAFPVTELELLRTKTRNIKPQPIVPGENPLTYINGELFDLTAEIRVGDAARIVFNLRGVCVSFDIKKQELSCKGSIGLLRTEGDRIRLRMLVDRTSIDIFGNDGRLYMPMGVAIDPSNRSLELSAEGSGAFINGLEVSELKSIWT